MSVEEVCDICTHAIAYFNNPEQMEEYVTNEFINDFGFSKEDANEIMIHLALIVKGHRE